MYEIVGEQMAFRYEIYIVSEKSKWIHISDSWGSYEREPFDFLVKYIQGERKLYSVGEDQYRIEKDPYKLIYQWDSCFGIVIIYKDEDDRETVLSFIQEKINKLNNIV